MNVYHYYYVMENGYDEAHLLAVNLPINFLKADRLESMTKFADELGVK